MTQKIKRMTKKELEKNKEDFDNMRYMRLAIKKNLKDRYKAECDHEFVHVLNKCWFGSEVVIYCKKCGATGVY